MKKKDDKVVLKKKGDRVMLFDSDVEDDDEVFDFEMDTNEDKK